jgi:hypothetical protein
MPDQDDRLARLEVLITEMDRRWETRFEQLEKRMVEGFAGIHKRLDDLQARMGSLEARMGSLDDRVETRLMGVEGRLTTIEGRLDHKAGNWVVSLWGATLAMLIGAATALVKLWP